MNLYIICLPMPTIWSLHMNRRRKVTIISVLAFGLVSVTVAILRLPVLISVSSMKTDVSIDVGKMIIVASFEVQCAIVAANLPATKALWTKFRGIFSSSGRSDPSLEKAYRLSIMRCRKRGDSKRPSSMGSITKLEKELESNESQEKLFEGTAGNKAMQSVDDDKSQQRSIVVTTRADVEHSPRL
jgi:hypothetical protein